MKLTYAVVFTRCPHNYGAYAPDVPGCISVGDTWDDVQAMIREALVFHIESMVEDGDPIPEPKMSLREAMTDYLEPIDEATMASYRQFGEPEPTVSVTFQMVEIEVEVREPVEAVGWPTGKPGRRP